MIPILSESQQIIRAVLRRHGDLTVEEVAAVSGLDAESDLQQLARKGCVESAGEGRWRLCDAWASRIVITEGGVNMSTMAQELATVASDKNVAIIVLDDCDDCPNFDNEHYSWNRTCTKLNRQIVWNDDYTYPIPGDCPVRVEIER